jgi:hypothetical protein
VRGKWIYRIWLHRLCSRQLSGGVRRAGGALQHSKRFTLIEELYFDQALGPAAKSARYLLPWTMLQFQFTSKFTNETVYFTYLPLNNSARIQQVIERSKFEYALGKGWRAGGGYGGYQYDNLEWQHKPFLTTTFASRAGEFEFWPQKMTGGAQIQLRYALVHTSH